MRKALRSLGHAREGLLHALKRERNFRLFFGGYALLLAYGYAIGITPAEAVALLLSGGAFLAVELLNTALERLVDAVDECRQASLPTEASAKAGLPTVAPHSEAKAGHDNLPHHIGLKATKDTAAAASLVSFLFFIVVAGIVFAPYLGL
ncbi:diacylglycerol kinase family protein [Candidatus Peregrinibacteria bacterium]|nr:diacylglycerol kinase family protein [Candidatus Peregrinibacteria bacterium]